MTNLSPAAFTIHNAIDRDSDPILIAASALKAAADQLPNTTHHSCPSQIFYNGSAMAANLLRDWADELTNYE